VQDVQAHLASSLSLPRLGVHTFCLLPSEAERIACLAKFAEENPQFLIHAPLARGELNSPRKRRVLRRALHVLGRPISATTGDSPTLPWAHDERFILEAAVAGLTFVARQGDWVWLRRAPSVLEALGTCRDAAPFRLELLAAARLLPTAERLRLRASPEHATDVLRRRGRTQPARTPLGRARLVRAIRWCDAMMPGSPNCFRRTLLEIGLDSEAANTPLVFGLDVGRTGHVALLGAEAVDFDVVFEVGPLQAVDDRRSRG